MGLIDTIRAALGPRQAAPIAEPAESQESPQGGQPSPTLDFAGPISEFYDDRFSGRALVLASANTTLSSALRSQIASGLAKRKLELPGATVVAAGRDAVQALDLARGPNGAKGEAIRVESLEDCLALLANRTPEFIAAALMDQAHIDAIDSAGPTHARRLLEISIEIARAASLSAWLGQELGIDPMQNDLAAAIDIATGANGAARSKARSAADRLEALDAPLSSALREASRLFEAPEADIARAHAANAAGKLRTLPGFGSARKSSASFAPEDIQGRWVFIDAQGAGLPHERAEIQSLATRAAIDVALEARTRAHPVAMMIDATRGLDLSEEGWLCEAFASRGSPSDADVLAVCADNAASFAERRALSSQAWPLRTFAKNLLIALSFDPLDIELAAALAPEFDMNAAARAANARFGMALVVNRNGAGFAPLSSPRRRG